MTKANATDDDLTDSSMTKDVDVEDLVATTRSGRSNDI